MDRRLIFRLSSLGDVVLASVALEVAPADWVVVREFAPLLEGHPRLGRLWIYDRRAQPRPSWRRFCRELWEADYSEVVDLHGSLRTRLAKLYFSWWGLKENKKVLWRKVPKQKLRFAAYCFLKGLFPKGWRPTPWVVRFAKTAGGSGNERPQLTHLLGSDGNGFLKGAYYCVMAGSAWPGKQWPPEKFADWISRHSMTAVLLGTEKDRGALKLEELLFERGVTHWESGIGKWDLRTVATVLGKSQGYFGNDTGLGHLAEALGVPAFMVFGPTVADSGYGPWGDESKAVGKSLWCRPCGKNGQSCHRIFRRHHCLKDLSVDEVKISVGKKWD